MKLQIFNIDSKFSCLLSGIVVICSWLGSTGISCANEDIWKVLSRDGDVMDLMAIEAMEDKAILVGAEYIEKQWQAVEDPDSIQIESPMIRKLLHVISVGSEEQIEWRHSYPAIPDVNEIYSTSRTKDGRLCIAYGTNYAGDEFINPIVLQIDTKGKIIWANRGAIPESSLPRSLERSYVQIANIESLRIVGSAENGCLLGYILRQQTEKKESFQLNLLMLNEQGDQQWHLSRDTSLYGKMFLVLNGGSNGFTVVQTNQSRDAAIEAMMAGRPFPPLTNFLVVDKKGVLKKFFDNEVLVNLSKVWVKDIVDVSGEGILLVGNSKNAWAGLVNLQGQVGKINNSLEGEYAYVRKTQSNGYIMVRGNSLVSFDEQLNSQFNKPIDQLIKKQYVNTFVEKKLNELGPIQNIVPLGKNSYFILYKLASRLQKIELDQ